jgi:hypothetical protein
MELKRLKDLGISPIKLDSKYGNKDIDNILHKANDLLFFFNLLYITETAKSYILTQIKVLGTDLKNVSMSMAQKSSSRKDELRAKLLDAYSKLNSYYPPSDNDINVVNAVEKMNRMQVAMYLKQKKESVMTDEDRFEWIRKIQMFSKAYDISDGLKSVNKEILDSYRI